MSLKQCKECHKVVSSKAINCPNCGYYNKNFFEKFKEIVYYSKIAFFTIIIISIISISYKMEKEEGRIQIAKSINQSIDEDIDLMKKVITQRLNK